MNITLGLTRIDAAGAGVIAAISAGLYFSVVAPAHREQDNLQRQRDILGAMQSEISAAERERAVLQSRAETLDEQFQRYKINPEPASRINARIASINDLAIKQGLTLSEVRSAPGATTPTGVAVPIHLGGGGAYAQIAGFIASLHAAFPDVALAGFEISGAPLEAARSEPIFSADLLWHASAENAAPAARTAPAALEGHAAAPTKPR